MEKLIKQINNVKVEFIDTNKFKTITGIMCFKTKVKKDTLTKRRLLKMILINSCNKYPTNALLNKNCLENYDADYSVLSRRDGIYYTNIFMFNVLDNRFTDKNTFHDVLNTFHEIIFNPNLKDGKFNSDEFNLAYNTLKSELERIKENPKSYADLKLSKQMGYDTPIGYDVEIEELDEITNEDLYKEYLDMIENSEVSMYIAGLNVSSINLDEFLKDVKTTRLSGKLEIESEINEYKEKEEDYDGTQSILTIGLKTKDLNKFESTYVMPIFNNILGGGTSSRLFNIVREENSLCYSCYSKYEKDDNLIKIYVGIESINYEKTLNLIKDIIKNMNNITDDELKRSINDITSSLRESLDYINNYVVPSYLRDLYNSLDIEEKIENIKKVKLNDIKNVFNKVYLTDSFFLKGGLR